VISTSSLAAKNPRVIIAISRGHNPQIYEGLCEFLKTCVDVSARVIVILPSCSPETYKQLSLIKLDLQVCPIYGLWRKFPCSLRLLYLALVQFKRQRSCIFVGCDAIGNVVAATCGFLTRARYINYSLELPARRDKHRNYLERLDSWSYGRADLVITMDKRRADFIALNTSADNESIVISPVSKRGPGQYAPNNFWRERFYLAPDAIIALHAGAIGKAQQSLELAESTRSWKNKINLVFHAHSIMKGESYYDHFCDQLGSLPKVHLSTEPLPSERLDEAVSGATVGIAWYDLGYLDHRAQLLGLAAGKIGRCLRNGIPVVVKAVPSVREYIEEYSCGVCVENLADIERAILEIVKDYKRFSTNALACYEQLWRADRYQEVIKVRIASLACSSGQ
jgi:glycosyltransferase involved in cell wall biosynthesis